MHAGRVCFGFAARLALLLALAGCASGAPGATGGILAPESPLPPTPPPTAAVTGESAGARTVALEGRMALRLALPPGFQVQTDHGDIFDVYHVWREPSPALPREASLEILVGQPQLAYCPPGTGSTSPAAFPRWRVEWHRCPEVGTGRPIWEVHVRHGSPAPIHIFVTGSRATEVEELVRIAESLEPAQP